MFACFLVSLQQSRRWPRSGDFLAGRVEPGLRRAAGPKTGAEAPGLGFVLDEFFLVWFVCLDCLVVFVVVGWAWFGLSCFVG